MQVLLTTHVVAAAVGLLTGAVALSAPKGRWLHRRSGVVFVVAMLAMCGSASAMAVVKGQPTNVIAALLTAYLVVTALFTVRPLAPAVRWPGAGLLLVALVLGATNAAFALEAFASASGTKFGYPPFPYLMFGSVGLVGAAGDLRVMRIGPLRGASRLARHLWRMCFAFWIATLSFFIVRDRVATVLPDTFTRPVVRAIPIVFVLLAMLYWLWRVRVKRVYQRIMAPARLDQPRDAVGHV